MDATTSCYNFFIWSYIFYMEANSDRTLKTANCVNSTIMKYTSCFPMSTFIKTNI